jgi:small subunit ribosomal protein S2
MDLETITNELDLKSKSLESEKEEALLPEADFLSLEQKSILEEMIRAGVIYGRKKTKTNPKMAKFIFTNRKGIDLFDLTKTVELLDKEIEFLRDKIDKKVPLLIVGTQPAAKELVKEFARKFGFSYVTERWLGGTLTNFKVISKRRDYMVKLREDKEAGRLEKYTKKEKLKLTEVLHKLEKFFSGIETLKQAPDAIFIIDPIEHETAVREANRLKIPIVAIASTDSDPDKIQHLIPANDNARSSIKWIMDYMEKKLTQTGS